MKKFLEVHNYNKENMLIKKPLTSDELKHNIDEQSYEILKDFKGIENIDKMKPLVEAVIILININRLISLISNSLKMHAWHV